MPDLNALQHLLHRMFRDEVSVGEVAERLGSDPRRLAIYHRFVHTHVRQALAANFPATLAALGEPASEALQAAYFEAHAPPDWNLDHAAAAFPDFLEARAADPFAVALARLEWEVAEVTRTDTEPGSGLNATLSVLQSPFPLVAWLADFHAGRPAGARPAAAPELALIFRHPSRDTGCHYAASDDLLFALKVTHDGLDPMDAARAAGLDPDAAAAAMARAREIGLVI